MTKLKMTSALFSFAMMASPAIAQDFVDAKIQELFAQGYTHFEVSRGFLRTEIEAYGPSFSKLEVRLSNADGSVVSQRSETESQTEYEENIREIARRNSNVREDRDDNDENNRDDDRGDDQNDDRYDGRDDDRNDDGNDDGNDDRDDDRNDDYDNDRNDDSDDDRNDDRDDD
nr:hypothetical protein [Yoonia sp.]